ncbi:helix-turn-helix domain-containing protein [Ralstonia sp. UBA689]|uniref:helix-turn-helix domain-containing protein n=1 Tax=Ralstonia sp. UBA689 TaxID=1947373 RepID=UPI0025EFD85A|nr:AraC family transcriptional regulator [Ralstonia sp. UBA689]
MSGNDIVVGLIHEGSHTVELPDGRQMSFGADQLFALDCAQQIRHHWRDSAVSYLWLPRGLVHETMLPDPAGVSAVAVALGNAKLAPFLAAQLNLLRTQSTELAPNTLHHVLNATIDLANLTVRSELLNSVNASARRMDGRMFAVWRYIEENLHKHDLAPKEIAQAINCSRAQLYRLFETQPFTVREAVKEARLKRSLHYLVRSDRKFDLGEIAAVCGFTDQSAFGKQFRQRFGLAPGKARRTGACAALFARLEAGENTPLG